MSNWEARPLSASQLHYASLDSHCLLALLDAMSLAMEGRRVTGVLDMYRNTASTDEVGDMTWYLVVVDDQGIYDCGCMQRTG